MNKKYSEEIVRYDSVNDEGKYYEILERITWERVEQADGSLGEPSVFVRRFDLQTGEPLTRLGDDEFECDESGVRLKVRR